MSTFDQQAVPLNPNQPPPYNPQLNAAAYNPGTNPPQVNVVHQVIQLRPEQFLTDYRVFAVVVTIIFGLLGPFSLLTGIPACFLAYKGNEFMVKGLYEKSRTKSIISAYLTFGTMFLSIISSTFIICILVGFRYSY